MTAQSTQNLQQRADQIRSEMGGNANTGSRVGTLLRDMVDSGYGLKPSGALVLANGVNNAVVLSSSFQLISGPSAGFSISGATPIPDANPSTDGKRVTVAYIGTQTLTLLHNDAGSASGFRLRCPTGANVALVPPANGFVSFDLIYVASSPMGWLVILPR